MDIVCSFSSDDNTPLKVCSKCRKLLPATPQYYGRNKTNPDGFQYYCKQCRSRVKPSELPPPPEGYKRCSKCKDVFPATPEFFHNRGAYRGRKPRLSSHCKQCKANVDKTYGETHKEERKQYRESRKEEDKQYMVTWRQENSEHVKRYDANYKATHKEQSSRQHKIYCQTYYRTKRGRIQQRVSTSNRRARRRNAEGTHTTDELRQQYERQKGRCYYCGKKLSKERKSWVEEHVIPLSRGGSNSIDNIVIACQPCNLSKGNKLPHEWEGGGRLL